VLTRGQVDPDAVDGDLDQIVRFNASSQPSLAGGHPDRTIRCPGIAARTPGVVGRGSLRIGRGRGGRAATIRLGEN